MSAFLFSIKDILSKKIFSKNVHPKQILFEEYFLMLFVILFLFFPKINFLIFIEYWYLFLFKALTLFVAVLTYLNLLKKYDISLVSPLMNLSPVFLIFLSFFILNEKLSLIQILGIFIVIISTYFLEIHIHHHNKTNPSAHILKNVKKLNYNFFLPAILMLIMISFTAIFDKLIFENNLNIYTNMYYTSLIIFLSLLIYYYKTNHLKLAFKNIIYEPTTLLISVFALISTFFILTAIAIPTALVSLIVPLKRVSSLFSSIFGGMLFHETHLVQKFISISFMLFGLFLIVF